MHASYVRAWFLAGLGALLLAIVVALLPLDTPSAAVLAGAGAGYLALALALGLLPAFARRDWPTPLYAWAAILLGTLALPFAWHERAFPALLGTSLLVGAAQPLALLAAPRWAAPREPNVHRTTDGAALAGVVLSLVAVAVAGLLLVLLPRGLPNSALAVLIYGGGLPAAFAGLVFVLPRQREEATPAATLAYGALVVLALSTAFLAVALHRPLAGLFRAPVAGVALALALGIATVLRLPRPERAKPLLATALALAVLAPLALLLATITGSANELLPVAYFAALAFAVAMLAAALVAAAPILLPGRVERVRWQRWAGALLIASLFLYTPAVQLGRSGTPALLFAAAGVIVLARGLAPLASSPPAPSTTPSAKRALRRR